MIDLQDMASVINIISELQCTKIAKTVVFTTEFWDPATTPIEIQFGSELPVTANTAHPGTITAGGDSPPESSKISDPATTATNTNTAYGENFLYLYYIAWNE